MSEWTVVVSRRPERSAWPAGDSGVGAAPAPDLAGVDPVEADKLEHELVSALQERGVGVLVLPHLYYLTAEHPACERLNRLAGDVIVASWLHPRAAYWTLHAQGVRQEGRVVSCLNLASFESAREALGECLRGIGAGRSATGPAPGRFEEVTGSVAPRWYPVLDYSRCVDCRQCMDFCLFGVYSVTDGCVSATSPANCKPGCPACARVCPEEAIMFPHYTGEPFIAGAPGAGRPEGAVAHAPAESGREPCPVCGCACDCERATDGPAPPGMIACPACGCLCDVTRLCTSREAGHLKQAEPACHSRESSTCECGSAGTDDLDDLVNALEQLDD